MALKNVANESMTLGHDVDSASLSVTTPASTKVKAGGQGVYKGNVSVSVSGAQSGNCAGASGSVTLIPTSTKVDVEGSKVLREGDQGVGTVTGNLTVNPFSSCNFSITVDVDDAGQSKVKAE